MTETNTGESSMGATIDSTGSPSTPSVIEATRIGRGMGVVYAAYDESLDHRVALELLLRKSSPRSRPRVIFCASRRGHGRARGADRESFSVQAVAATAENPA